MRKLIVSETITTDGYFSGPGGEIDWFILDDEFNKYSLEMLDSVDTLLFGRTTYEMMVAYWPTAQGEGYSREIAKRMNSHTKVGVSKEPLDLSWHNSRQIKSNLTKEVAKLKRQPEGDIAILGSGSLVVQLTDAGLVDEYWLMVAPVVLGKGRTLFQGVNKPTKLKLIEARMFRSGYVLHRYELDKREEEASAAATVAAAAA